MNDDRLPPNAPREAPPVLGPADPGDRYRYTIRVEEVERRRRPFPWTRGYTVRRWVATITDCHRIRTDAPDGLSIPFPRLPFEHDHREHAVALAERYIDSLEARRRARARSGETYTYEPYGKAAPRPPITGKEYA